MPKSQKKQLKREQEAEAQLAQDLSGQTLEPATAFFSPEHARQDARSSRRTRNNSFVGDTLLNVLEEVQQGTNGSRPPTRAAMSAPKAFVDGSNDEPTPKDRMSTAASAQQNTQNPPQPFSDGFTSQTLSPPTTLPGSVPGAPFGYNLANAMWNWNNPYASVFAAHENTTQASGYQQQALPPNGPSGAPGSMSGAWGQTFTPVEQFGFPGSQIQAPQAASQFAYINPSWRVQSQAGLPAWISPHQKRAMDPTQYRGIATDSQTPSWRVNASGNGQLAGGNSQPQSPPKSPKREKPNKPGPPRPDPSLNYLAQSAMISYRLPIPQPLLIVMDLNGTLLYRPKRSNSSHFVQRPFTPPFVSYLFANHTVMVWSSARPENVNRMCNGLFSSTQRKQLVAEWGRDMLGLTQKQFNEKVQVYKQLDKVWQTADTQQWHPLHAYGQRFNQANTLLIDDSVEKAASEPYNLVEVDDFEGKEDQMNRDVLREVAGYIEEAKWQSNVSAWVRAGNRFACGMGWDRDWQDASLPLVASSLATTNHLDEALAPAPTQAQSGRVLRSHTRKTRLE
ncbi:hypothetical protein BKA80DRAFT_229089 [Phyllosticta citrichinensis]